MIARPSGPPFFGKYRGVVSDISDVKQMGRIRARVPDIYGDQESGWAMPCAPFGGDGMGFFALPKVGAGVWFEFEHGDPDFPIWTGTWWGNASQRPPALLTPPWKKTILLTEGGHQIILDDTPGAGGITLQTSDGAKITMTALGIEIDNGKGAKIKLQGPQVVVNDGALEVI